MAFQKEQKCLQGSTDGEIFHSVLLRGNNLKKKKVPMENRMIPLSQNCILLCTTLCCAAC